MSAVDALKLARAAGVRIGLDGYALTLDADAAPPREVLELLALHKAHVIALLCPGRDGWSGDDWRAFFDERAAIAEFAIKHVVPRAEHVGDVTEDPDDDDEIEASKLFG